MTNTCSVDTYLVRSVSAMLTAGLAVFLLACRRVILRVESSSISTVGFGTWIFMDSNVATMISETARSRNHL